MFRTSSVHHQERFVQAVFADFGMWYYCAYYSTRYEKCIALCLMVKITGWKIYLEDCCVRGEKFVEITLKQAPSIFIISVVYTKGKIEAQTEIFEVAFNGIQFIAVFVVTVQIVKVGETKTYTHVNSISIL